MGILEAALEEGLSRLSDAEWAALTARVRPPKSLRYPAKRDSKRGKLTGEMNSHG
jgi:hypothetical protein